MNQMENIKEKNMAGTIRFLLESLKKINHDHLLVTFILCSPMSIEKIIPWKEKSENGDKFYLSEIVEAANGGFEYSNSNDGKRIHVTLEVANHDPNKPSIFGLEFVTKEGIIYKTEPYSYAGKDVYRNVACKEMVKASTSKGKNIQSVLTVLAIIFILCIFT